MRYNKGYKKGYISIESLVITAMVVGIGIIALMQLQIKANNMIDRSLISLETLSDSVVVLSTVQK